MLAKPLLDEVVRSKAALARPAVNQRVIEALDMSRRLPNARMHQNAGIEPDDVPTLVHESAPPQLFDIAFELDSERTTSSRSGLANTSKAPLPKKCHEFFKTPR